MVGHQPLELSILVRVQVPQPSYAKSGDRGACPKTQRKITDELGDFSFTEAGFSYLSVLACFLGKIIILVFQPASLP